MSGEESEPSDGLVNINVTDIFGVGKASEQLTPVAKEILEKVSSGLGWIANPAKLYLTSRSESRATAKNMVEQAEAKKLVAQIEIDTAALISRAGTRLITQEAHRQKNIESITALAVGMGTKSSEKVREIDEDWMSDWMSGASDAYADELKSIWAKLLASAADQTKTKVSRSTIQLVKTLDASLASNFDRICRYNLALGPIFSPVREAYYSEKKSSDDLGIDPYMLVEIGLVEKREIVGFSLSEGIFVPKNGLPAPFKITSYRPSLRGHQLRSVLYPGLQINGRQQQQFDLVSEDNQHIVLSEMFLCFKIHRSACYIYLTSEEDAEFGGLGSISMEEKPADIIVHFESEENWVEYLTECNLSDRVSQALEKALKTDVREDGYIKFLNRLEGLA